MLVRVDLDDARMPAGFAGGVSWFWLRGATRDLLRVREVSGVWQSEDVAVSACQCWFADPSVWLDLTSLNKTLDAALGVQRVVSRARVETISASPDWANETFVEEEGCADLVD